MAVDSRQIVLILIAVTAAGRVLLAGGTGLGVDESYMVGHGRELSLSYVDQPPLHVWIVGVLAKLTGSENGLLLRVPFIALFAGTTWLLYRLTADLFDERAGMWAALLLNLSPVFTLSGATWILPEGPVDFFLLAGAGVVARILLVEPLPRRPLLLWLAAGVLGGFALLAKYHGVFLFVGTLAFLLSVPTARRWLATPGPWLGAAIALLIFLPVVIWNLQHDLAGLRFQSDRLGNPGFSVLRLLGSIGAQSAYLAIWAFVPLVVGLLRALLSGPREKRNWFLAMLAVGPITLFSLATLWAPGLPHWTAPGWLFAMPLAGVVLAGWSARMPRLIRGSAFAAAAALLLFVAVILSQLMTGWVTRLVPDVARADVTRDLLDWDQLRPALADGGLLDDDTIVAAPHWIQAGKVSRALGPDVEVLCLCARPQHFAYRYSLADLAGRDVVLVAERGGPGSGDDMASFFDAIEPLDERVEILRFSGAPAITLDIAIGRGLRAPE